MHKKKSTAAVPDIVIDTPINEEETKDKEDEEIIDDVDAVAEEVNASSENEVDDLQLENETPQKRKPTEHFTIQHTSKNKKKKRTPKDLKNCQVHMLQLLFSKWHH